MLDALVQLVADRHAVLRVTLQLQRDDAVERPLALLRLVAEPERGRERRAVAHETLLEGRPQLERLRRVDAGDAPGGVLHEEPADLIAGIADPVRLDVVRRKKEPAILDRAAGDD